MYLRKMLTSGARGYLIPFVRGNPEVSGSPLSRESCSKTALLQVRDVGLTRRMGLAQATPPGRAAAHRYAGLQEEVV